MNIFFQTFNPTLSVKYSIILRDTRDQLYEVHIVRSVHQILKEFKGFREIYFFILHEQSMV